MTEEQEWSEAVARVEQRQKQCANVGLPVRMGRTALLDHVTRKAQQHAALATTEDRVTPTPPAEPRDARRLRLLQSFGVPQAYLHASRKSWEPNWHGEPSPWPEAVDGWDASPWCLTLVGEPGVGKTHVAVSVLQEFVRRRWHRLERGRLTGDPKRVAFVSVPIACQEIRDAYTAKDHKAAARYSRIAKSWELVLYDDVGAQPERENWRAVVSGWIYERHLRQLPTIITANPGEFSGLDERTARRVLDGLVVDSRERLIERKTQ